jgi:erythromycin esterase-like protein/predicted phosphoribosyltransferase
MMKFTDRQHAGSLLAKKLLHFAFREPVIIALPRGGVPVASEIAKELGAPLNVLFVKKIGAPGNPEFAIGALPETGPPLLHHEVIKKLKLDQEEIDHIIASKAKELRAQSKKFRRVCPEISLKARVLILVDDGLATGASMQTAIEAARAQQPSNIIVAVPVASRSAIKKLEAFADEVICLVSSTEFFSVGAYYNDFTQVSDEEALEFLKQGHGSDKVHIEIRDVSIMDKTKRLEGEVRVPTNSKGLIIFAHGSGSTHKSPRNQFVGEALNSVGFSTLLFDLLTPSEQVHRANVFDIELLTHRLVVATEWAKKELGDQPIGYFGASTGAAAAIGAAARAPDRVFAIISRGGRVDMAPKDLSKVQCPTLLIVGGLDSEVIRLNQEAFGQLREARFVTIPGAGHVFEEPGTLERVAEYAMDWFVQNLNPLSEVLPSESVNRELETRAHAVGEKEGLDEIVERCAKSRVVMLGEATHGTKEFYELRRMISQRLIADHGFSFIAVEGDWPDCRKLNDYIREGTGGTARRILHSFNRWPTWMWANEETVHLIEWMRKGTAGFYGLDVYSLFESLDVVKSYLRRLDSKMSEKLANRYACFEPFGRNEIAYAKSLVKFPMGCEEDVIFGLRQLLRIRLEEQAEYTESELFDLQQNARIIQNAEHYYRIMLAGGPESWNLRDHHMLETLDLLLERSNGKGIVWAHNTHIGDYHATEMVESGYINLGGLAREKYGMDQVCLVGFGTYQGKVLAGRSWGAPAQVMNLPPAQNGTYESYFHELAEKNNSERLFINFDAAARNGPMSRRLGHRAVGVVYQPENESHGSNYVQTALSKRYDAFVYVDQTSELIPLGTTPAKGLIPETWPGGH